MKKSRSEEVHQESMSIPPPPSSAPPPPPNDDYDYSEEDSVQDECEESQSGNEDGNIDSNMNDKKGSTEDECDNIPPPPPPPPPQQDQATKVQSTKQKTPKKKYVEVEAPSDTGDLEEVIAMDKSSPNGKKESVFVEDGSNEPKRNLQKGSPSRLKGIVPDDQLEDEIQKIHEKCEKEYQRFIRRNFETLLENKTKVQQKREQKNDAEGNWRKIPENLSKEELQAEIEILEKKLKRITRENIDLEKEADMFKEEIRQRQMHVNDLQDENDELNEKLSEMN